MSGNRGDRKQAVASDAVGEDAASIIETRRGQAFPELTRTEVDRLRRFGEVRGYVDGERLFAAGKNCRLYSRLLPAGQIAAVRFVIDHTLSCYGSEVH